MFTNFSEETMAEYALPLTDIEQANNGLRRYSAICEARSDDAVFLR